MAEIAATPHHDDIASSSTASCSASASTSYVHYDIFISHCGSDADIFAKDLYRRLHSRGLHIFLDELHFMFEEEVTSQREAAISLASVRIVIFSPNYAEWKWCLDALIHMTKSEGTILPVFYKMKPSEVRWTGKNNNGPYALWMRDHEEKRRFDSQTIQTWRDVLHNVSNISGFELEACDGGEEELLHKIVESVFKGCPPRDYDVFISHRGPDTKEAFAGPLYDCLIRHGLRVFLDKPELVEGLRIAPQIELALQFASVHIAIFSPTYAQSCWCLDELFLMIKSRAPILPVLYELNYLDLHKIYDETLLSHQKKQRYDSETIERWKGALADIPKSDAFVLDGAKEELIDKIVQSVLEYIPKRSEVMQSSEVVRSVVEVPRSVVECVLSENVAKQSEVELSVEECVRSLNLKWVKCRISRENEHLRSLMLLRHRKGTLETLERSKVKEIWWLSESQEFYPSRLSRLSQLSPLPELNTFAGFLKFPKPLGQLAFLGKIVVKILDDQPLPLKTLPKEFGQLLSLKYLELRQCSTMMSLPDSFGQLTNLQYINLKGASRLQMLPTSFRNLILLQHLSLAECSEIQELPGVEQFTSLETMDVRGCKKIKSISGLEKLTKLQILDVSGCCEVRKFADLKHLSSLKTLNVSGCKKLESIRVLGLLTKLQTVDVSECSELMELSGVEHLTSLKDLNVSGCKKLKSIPGLRKLAKLQTLNVNGCCEMQTLSGLQYLESLVTLSVCGCEKLQSIPPLWKLVKRHNLFYSQQ